MTKLFISYRRNDTAAHAGRLYDRLSTHFGRDQLFMDVDGIEPGQDFTQVIAATLRDCDAVIVLIGPRWLLEHDGAGARRIDQTDDFVHLEVAQALASTRRVIPVLVGGARMPSERELPPPLAPLARRHALEIRDGAAFHRDVEPLIAAVERPLAARAVAPGTADVADTEVRATSEPQPAFTPRSAPATESTPPASISEATLTPQRALAAAGLAAAIGLAGWWGLVYRAAPVKLNSAAEISAAPAPQVAPQPALNLPPPVTPRQEATPAQAGVLGSGQPVSSAVLPGAESLSAGYNSLYGNSVPKNAAEALRQFRIAAGLGNAEAVGAVGYMLEHGQGARANLREALRFYQQAAQAGDAMAQNNLASHYLEGRGVAKNFSLALDWYRKSAAQSNVLAQSNLGLVYENGWGVKRDSPAAIRWYQLAAKQGDKDAFASAQRLIDAYVNQGAPIAATAGAASSASNVEFEQLKLEMEKLSQMQKSLSNVLETMDELSKKAIRHIKA